MKLCALRLQTKSPDIEVDGNVNNDAAWHYPEPKEAAKEIKDHIAFWKGIEVTS